MNDGKRAEPGKRKEGKKKKNREREGEGGKRNCKAFIFPLYFVIKEILWLLQVTH